MVYYAVDRITLLYVYCHVKLSLIILINSKRPSVEQHTSLDTVVCTLAHKLTHSHSAYPEMPLRNGTEK